MPLITADAFAEDPFTTLGDDGDLPPSGGAIVSIHRFRRERELLLARNTPIGVRLKSEESPEELGDDIHRLSVVVLEFSKFSDGRSFSWARMLRQRFGFTGEIRASGEFLFDQIAYQHRVGFDSWVVPQGFTIEDFRRALLEITNVYQPSADGKKTIRELRALK